MVDAPIDSKSRGFFFLFFMIMDVSGVHFLPESQPLGTMLLHTVFINDQCD